MTNKNFYLCKGFQIQKKPLKPIIFYHIPKCAGTTFSVVFSYLFKKIYRIPGSLTGERGGSIAFDFFKNNKEKILKNEPHFIYGHLPYEVSEYFPNYLSITFIRNPLKRCVSHLNFIVSRGWLEINNSSNKLDLDHCFESGIIPDNIITRQFCGRCNKNLKVSEEDYINAIKTLHNKIDYICDTEDSLDFYNHIISVYDLPNLLFQNQQEKNKKYFEANKLSREIINKHNKYDIKIYENLKINNKLFKIFDRKTPRKKDKYFYSSPNLMINNKKQYFLNEKDFIEIYKKLENNKFSIVEAGIK